MRVGNFCEALSNKVAMHSSVDNICDVEYFICRWAGFDVDLLMRTKDRGDIRIGKFETGVNLHEANQIVMEFNRQLPLYKTLMI